MVQGVVSVNPQGLNSNTTDLKVSVQGENEELVDYLRGELDDDLRAVGRYDREGYDPLFIRDDVIEEYATEDIEEIHHEMVLKGLGNQHLETLFKGDDLDCSIYQFEDKVRLHFVRGDYRGLYVSFDWHGDVNPSRIVDRCKSIMA